MFLERRVSRSLQAVVLPLADREPQPKLQCRLEQRPWNLALPERIDDVDRLPEHQFRNEVGSLAHAERGARGEAGRTAPRGWRDRTRGLSKCSARGWRLGVTQPAHRPSAPRVLCSLWVRR